MDGLARTWRLPDMDYPAGGKRIPRENVYLPPLQLELDGLNRQEALYAIIDILSICQQRLRRVNLPSVLEAIHKYISKSLEPTQSGKLEFIVGKHDWQVWTKYKKALSDFQAGLLKDWRNHLIEEYETINSVMIERPYIATDRDFFVLANRIQSLTSRPPVGVDVQYWNSISPHAFTVKESHRAIDKVSRLHQEWQWATHGEGGNEPKGLWLFVWRVLKKLWLLHNQEGQGFPVAVAAAASQLEKPLLDKYTSSFMLMDRTSEVLHHGQAELMVAEYAQACYHASSASQKLYFNKSAKLTPDAKDCMHAFIHGRTSFTAKVAAALRTTAARYYIQRLKQDRHDDDPEYDRVEEIDSADEAPSSTEEFPREFPMPVALARKSPYDYVWYDMPDTRAREVAEHCRIERDMTEPGIQSDGLRVSELVNIPPRHARRPGQISRWKSFAPVFGPISFPWRIARYWMSRKRWRHSWVLPLPRVTRRVLTRPLRDEAEHELPPTPLSPVRDNASRIVKPKTSARLPTVKLRGGGPKQVVQQWQNNWSKEQADLIAELAKEIGITDITIEQANFLVGSYLTSNQWNVEAAAQVWKEDPVPIEDMRYDLLEVGLLSQPPFTALTETKRRVLRLLLAALGKEKVSQMAMSDITDALEDQDWRWEAALVDLRGDSYPEDSHFVSTFVASDPRGPPSSADKRSHTSRRSRSQSSRVAGDEDVAENENAIPGDASAKSNLSKSSSNVSKKSAQSARSRQSEGRAAQPGPDGSPTSLPRKSPKPGQEPLTTPTRRHANIFPKRVIHAGPQGYATDSRSDDDDPEELVEVPAELNVSPSQAANARRLERQRQRAEQAQAQQDEFADDEFDIYGEDFTSQAQSGLADRISDFDSEPARRPSASDSPFDKENATPPSIQVQEGSPGPCHPCPQYDGQYHHICSNDCAFGAQSHDNGESKASYREPEDLPHEVGSSPRSRHQMLLGMDADIRKIIQRQNKDGNKLNEVQIHARLRRILEVAAVWPTGDFADYDPLPVRESSWEQFLLPEPIEEQSDMGYAAWRTLHHNWQAAIAGHARRAALQAIRGYLIAFIAHHYQRNSAARCASASSNVAQVETFRPFSHYHRVARNMQNDLIKLQDLFAEVDGFSGMQHCRRTHAEHHDSFRSAYCNLLVLRRGLGQLVTDAECDQIPSWDDYRLHGQAPFQELHDWVRNAVVACEPIIAFFKERDSEIDLTESLEFLEDAVAEFRKIIYGDLDPASEETTRLPASVPKPSSGGSTEQSRKRRSTEANNDDAEAGTPKRPRKATPRPASSARGGSAKSVNSSEKENAQPKKNKNQARQPLAPIEQNDEDDAEAMVEVPNGQDTQEEETDESPISPKKRASKKAANRAEGSPTAKADQQKPTAADYMKWLYADEIKDEVKHRGIPDQKTKDKNIKALVAADNNGNTGLGVMMGWRKFNGKKETDKRPESYMKPSAEQVQKKFGDRLI